MGKATVNYVEESRHNRAEYDEFAAQERPPNSSPLSAPPFVTGQTLLDRLPAFDGAAATDFLDVTQHCEFVFVPDARALVVTWESSSHRKTQLSTTSISFRPRGP